MDMRVGYRLVTVEVWINQLSCRLCVAVHLAILFGKLSKKVEAGIELVVGVSDTPGFTLPLGTTQSVRLRHVMQTGNYSPARDGFC
jgi:hypothetical protein